MWQTTNYDTVINQLGEKVFEKLFESPYKERIIKVLPTLFNMVELENRRGKKLGMEVGTARERVLIALLMYVYGSDLVEFPESTAPELDVWVNHIPLSIKTKMNSVFSGVKLAWTVDWHAVNKFHSTYSPQSDMLFVSINWGTDKGGFFLFPKSTQQQVFNDLGRSSYIKLPKRGTNPRGVELSADAMRALQAHNGYATLTN